MKNLLLTILLILGAGGLAWTASFYSCCDHRLHAVASDGDAMGWLQVEFKLDTRQMEQIMKLHKNYSAECEEHCRLIGEAKSALKDAEKEGRPVERLAALRLVDEREATCRNAIRGHLKKVAELMPAGQGERYLAMMIPRVDHFQHTGAPTLRMNQ